VLLPLGILASAGGAAPADYELITTTVLSSSAASVTFSGLGTSAAAYKHLQIRYVARDNRGISGPNNVSARLNTDTGSNYSHHRLYGDGASVSSFASTSQTSFLAGAISSNSDTANAFGAAVLDLLDFSSTSKNKTIRLLAGVSSTGSAVQMSSGAWYSTAAVTEIQFNATSGSFVSGSRFSIYGLKG